MQLLITADTLRQRLYGIVEDLYELGGIEALDRLTGVSSVMADFAELVGTIPATPTPRDYGTSDVISTYIDAILESGQVRTEHFDEDAVETMEKSPDFDLVAGFVFLPLDNSQSSIWVPVLRRVSAITGECCELLDRLATRSKVDCERIVELLWTTVRDLHRRTDRKIRFLLEYVEFELEHRQHETNRLSRVRSSWNP